MKLVFNLFSQLFNNESNRKDINQTSEYDLFAYGKYFEERMSLAEGERKIAISFDKAIMTLSGGAIALSMTFLDKIAPESKDIYLLISAWISFAFSLSSILFSMILSIEAYKYEIDRVDKAYSDNKNPPSSEKNKFTISTDFCNKLSLFTLILGIILLSIFSYVNLKKVEEYNLNKNNKVNRMVVTESKVSRDNKCRSMVERMNGNNVVHKSSSPPPPAVRPPRSSIKKNKSI